MMEEIWGGWPGYILITAAAVGVVAIVVVLIWQLFSTLQAWLASRAELARTTEYHRLAEKAVTIQETLAEEQQRIVRELAAMRDSVANMERLLREVE